MRGSSKCGSKESTLYDVGINTKVYSCPVEALKFIGKIPPYSIEKQSCFDT